MDKFKYGASKVNQVYWLPSPQTNITVEWDYFLGSVYWWVLPGRWILALNTLSEANSSPMKIPKTNPKSGKYHPKFGRFFTASDLLVYRSVTSEATSEPHLVFCSLPAFEGAKGPNFQPTDGWIKQLFEVSKISFSTLYLVFLVKTAPPEV